MEAQRHRGDRNREILRGSQRQRPRPRQGRDRETGSDEASKTEGERWSQFRKRAERDSQGELQQMLTEAHDFPAEPFLR